ncbi:MAG: hypothetical protein ABW215_05840 [Kibdelosporangium sp.]
MTVTETEELIKSALARQAERAPHPGPIRHVLNRPRARPVWPAFAAVAGGCALAIAATLLVVLPGTGGSVDTAGESPAQATMAYQATDIPAGFVEVERTSGDGGSAQSRTWRAADGVTIRFGFAEPGGFGVGVRPGRADGEPVTVNGVPATLTQQDDPEFPGSVVLTWRPAPPQVLMVQVSAGPGQRELAKRVAGSVRPDGVTAARPLVAFDWLPAEFTRFQFTTGKDGTGHVFMADPQGSTLSVFVQAKGSPPASGGSWPTALPDGRAVRVVFPNRWSLAWRVKFIAGIRPLPTSPW